MSKFAPPPKEKSVDRPTLGAISIQHNGWAGYIQSPINVVYRILALRQAHFFSTSCLAAVNADDI